MNFEMLIFSRLRRKTEDVLDMPKNDMSKDFREALFEF